MPKWPLRRSLFTSTARLHSTEASEETEQEDYHSIIKDTERGKGKLF